VATRWDGESDAARFRAAYLRTLAVRFPGQRLRESAGQVRLRRTDGTWLVLSARGRDVDIVDGAHEAELPALLAALATAVRAPGEADSQATKK
jgi:hypothetical protein